MFVQTFSGLGVVDAIGSTCEQHPSIGRLRVTVSVLREDLIFERMEIFHLKMICKCLMIEQAEGIFLLLLRKRNKALKGDPGSS